MIAMTTSSSIRVKPRTDFRPGVCINEVEVGQLVQIAAAPWDHLSRMSIRRRLVESEHCTVNHRNRLGVHYRRPPGAIWVAVPTRSASSPFTKRGRPATKAERYRAPGTAAKSEPGCWGGLAPLRVPDRCGPGPPALPNLRSAQGFHELTDGFRHGCRQGGAARDIFPSHGTELCCDQPGCFATIHVHPRLNCCFGFNAHFRPTPSGRSPSPRPVRR